MASYFTSPSSVPLIILRSADWNVKQHAAIAVEPDECTLTALTVIFPNGFTIFDQNSPLGG